MRLSVIDINQKEYKKQSEVALLGFLAEFPNLVIEIINGIFSNSMFVWADCWASFESTSQCAIVYLTAHRIEKETGETYNFGVERLETLVSLLCNLLILAGYLVIVITAFFQLFHPAAPTDAIGYFLLLKATNVLTDSFFYIEKRRIQKKNPTRLSQTEASRALENLAADSVTGAIACVCCFFRAQVWSWYVSPAAALVLGAAVIPRCLKRIISSFSELSDKSFSIAQQDAVFDIVLEHTNLIERIISVNCRTMNDKSFVEITAAFKNNVTYEQQTKLMQEIDKEIQAVMGSCTLKLIIEPKE